MATPTISPTADTPTETAPAAPAGRLASILAPVEPARPSVPIGSTASLAEEPREAVVGDSKPTKSGSRTSTGQEGHWAALVRAVASRIARTGTANTIKRQHTITESRMTGNQVNTAQRLNRDTKHSGLNHRDAKLNDNSSKIRQDSGRNHHESKTSDAKASTNSGQSRTGRDTKDHKQRSDASTGKKDVLHTTARDGLDPRRGKDADAKPTKPTGTKDTPAKGAEPAAAKKDPATKTDSTKKEVRDDKPTTKPTDKTTTTTPPPRTRPSREAGYRDGDRAATVAGHVKAYRDGTKDGWADRTAEYEKEKRRMDDAKARTAVRPTAPAKPDMIPVSGSTVDLAKKDAPAPVDAKPPVPVTLTGISESHVAFDADGTSHHLSRAEVRTLKGFEQRMAAKVPVLQQVAETSKTTRAKAAEHAARAQRLAEAAETVEGGARLAAKLHRLAEAAQNLHTKTEEIEKAAHRGAETVRTLVTNTGTRHGGIYKAVVDSPLTRPAEREFYTDTESS